MSVGACIWWKHNAAASVVFVLLSVYVFNWPVLLTDLAVLYTLSTFLGISFKCTDFKVIASYWLAGNQATPMSRAHLGSLPVSAALETTLLGSRPTVFIAVPECDHSILYNGGS